MVVKRKDTRWNGWGSPDVPDTLSSNPSVWEWMAAELGMGALMTTPAIPLEEIELPQSRLDSATLSALASVTGKGGGRFVASIYFG